METKVKTVVPNKSWIVQCDDRKVATLNKGDSGYNLLFNGKSINVTLEEIKSRFGIVLDDHSEYMETVYSVHGFPVDVTPVSVFWDIDKKLPLYTKKVYSTSLYCAGYYVMHDDNGASICYCPKLIKLRRHVFSGPYKTLEQAKSSMENIYESD